MTRSKSLMAEIFLTGSQDHQIIPMHDFDPLEPSGLDFAGVKTGDAAREFHAVQIANPHDFTRLKITLATRHAGRQEALAAFAQRLLGALVHEERASGMMKKGD